MDTICGAGMVAFSFLKAGRVIKLMVVLRIVGGELPA